ncbi:TlpA family protein disulfide reductase [Compostimonas suwonensis]|uniref:Thiol-disulfide isomerase/thioredoxin n=1 Tax=Compostimonas suwonensis TaxID=1048394 RepID=A0A2M9BTT8_9MICO|nr:thioredoxin family protein [Compostimonas suwonensis]PJJ61350.1 thiol-disulfide isomerase/thioredoxin [Compostimonas suwonensis]
MNWIGAAAAVLGLVAVATAAGLIWRARTGRARAQSGLEIVTAQDVASETPFGTSATLLQFSTEFCARCPATRTMLGATAARHPGIAHVDVDLTHRADLADRFHVMQTPTTLILDRHGAVRARIGGAPRPQAVREHLDRILQEA